MAWDSIATQYYNEDSIAHESEDEDLCYCGAPPLGCQCDPFDD